jgi:hypothetical protein
MLAAPVAVAEPTEPNEPPAATVIPDLGTIRYHDPSRRREVWLGFDGGGVALPASVTGIGRRIWSAYAAPTWAVALTRRFAIGGRHKVSWYDARNIRLRVHGHELFVSGRMMKHRPRMRDRPEVGFEVHDVKLSVVDGVDFRLGGIRDAVLHFGYGLEHDLTDRLQLGWRAGVRQVWVFKNTQRQARVAARLAYLPWDRHRFSLEGVGFYVNRDHDQAGEPAPRNSVHAQTVAEYSWLSRAGVGVMAGARYATSFLSGETPIYEIRPESVRRSYGEVFAGLRVVWE